MRETISPQASGGVLVKMSSTSERPWGTSTAISPFGVLITGDHLPFTFARHPGKKDSLTVRKYLPVEEVEWTLTRHLILSSENLSTVTSHPTAPEVTSSAPSRTSKKGLASGFLRT